MPCHNGTKRREERTGRNWHYGCDIDGTPTDPQHPYWTGIVPPRPRARDPGLYPRYTKPGEADRDD
jgi:hypothetical protein